MAKVRNRFTKLGRALSTSHHESSTASKKRSRSISEILDSDQRSLSDQPSLSSMIDGGGGLRGGASGEESLVLVYHGYTVVDEPRFNKDVLQALRSIRTTGYSSSKHVTLSYSSKTLRVAEGAEEAILVCPLHAVGVVSAVAVLVVVCIHVARYSCAHQVSTDRQPGLGSIHSICTPTRRARG